MLSSKLGKLDKKGGSSLTLSNTLNPELETRHPALGSEQRRKVGPRILEGQDN